MFIDHEWTTIGMAMPRNTTNDVETDLPDLFSKSNERERERRNEGDLSFC